MAEIGAIPIVASAVVGGGELSAWSAIEWSLPNFSSHTQAKNDPVICPPLKCHGTSWTLYVYPRGKEHDAVELREGYVSITIEPKQRDIMYTCKLWIKCSDSRRHLFGNAPAAGKADTFFLNAINRRTLLASGSPFMNDGALIIQLELQIKQEAEEIPTSYSAPKWKLGHDMRKMLKSGRSADVTFVVDGTSFPAQKSMLEFRAPTLHELCEDASPGAKVPIGGVSAPIFEAILDHVYTNEDALTDLLTQNTRELLDAADRFGCEGIKLLAETELVRSGVTSDNVVPLLLLADAKSCALLKEAAMNCIASDPTAAMASEDWGKVKESNDLLVEIMEAAFGKKRSAATTAGGDEAEYDAMNVSTLRRKLDDACLSGDGTREMLVKRLKTHHSNTDDSSA